MPRLAFLFVAAGAGALPAQESAPIQDNSFLIEEAYNQERGVVQHILTRAGSEDNETYSFTQEWPLGGIRHQVSYTIPVLNGGGTGVGDIALNYRYQLTGDGSARLAVAPRATLVLPTGSEASGRGAGGVGFQVNLPVTAAIASHWVAHGNAGATVTPSAADGSGATATTSTYNLGGSLVWLARPKFNALLEALWTSEESLAPGGGTLRNNSFVLVPGIRGAVDWGGVQIVPGIGVPITLTSGSDVEVFGYLSVEHGF